jgi:predicted membrane protein
MFWGAVLILFGVLFLLDNFYILDFSELIHDFWPLILVAIGIKILYDRSRQPADDDVVQWSDQPPAMDGDRSSSDSLSESNVFGDIDLRITSDKFRGGSVNNVFGDIRLDISQVQLAAGTTKVFISGIFGDITIVTPKDIPVQARTNSIAGDISIRGKKKEGLFPNLEHSEGNFEKSDKRLSIQCSIVFGSINIY